MLHALADGIWEVRDTLKMPMFVRFPIRMTVLSNAARELVLVSPVAIDDALAREIDALGRVVLLVAPNLLHHLFAKRAQQRWPQAKLVVAPGLVHKCPELRDAAVLTPGTLTDGVEVFAVAGAPSIEEHLFLHRASRTLVVTDLVFNVRSGVNFATWLVFALLAGTFGRLAPSRVWRFAVRDRAATQKSLQLALASDFERVVVAHGDVIDTGGKEILRKALGSMC